MHLIQALNAETDNSQNQPIDKSKDDVRKSPAETVILPQQHLLKGSQIKHIPKDHATIYGCSEDERGTLEVPLQEVFRGPREVLTSEAASTPLSTLGLEGLLDRMNFYLGTSFSLDERKSLLDTTVEALQNLKYADDFGFAYALLRPRWKLDPLEAIQEILDKREIGETKRRPSNRFPLLPATGSKEVRLRRVWDLWSNRVIPAWMARGTWKDGLLLDVGWWFAVSHVWMEKPELVDSPINGHQWLVPIPRETNLERVRTELLHVTSKDLQYAWLDVLCLRQKQSLHPEEKSVLSNEWKVDVP